MSVLEQLNSGGVYLICGGIIAFIAAVCVVFMIRAWRAGKALGMDVTRMKRAVTASATFSVLPSVGILLGVLALSGTVMEITRNYVDRKLKGKDIKPMLSALDDIQEAHEKEIAAK